MPHILVFGISAPAAIELLERREDISYEIVHDASEADVIKLAPKADGIMVRLEPVTQAVVDAAPGLRVVSRHGVGYDTVNVAALTKRGIPLTVTATANAVSVAEHAISLLFALRKQTLAMDRFVRESRWSERNTVESLDLDGTTLLLVGFGRIGRKLAPRAQALGMRVLVLDPYVSDAEASDAGCELVNDLHSSLGRADAVSLHTPLTDDTRDLMDARAFRALKPGSVLINTSRGGLVDENALLDALRSGHLAGAGLDTLRSEPPPPDHPLLLLENVVFSPHAAGMSREAQHRMAIETTENTLAGLDGTLTPQVVVNRTVLQQA